MIRTVYICFISLILVGCTTIVPTPEPVERPSGLVRTYIEGPIATGSAILISDDYTNIIESETKAAFLAAMEGKGFTLDQQSGMTLRIITQTTDAEGARLGQSVFQVRGDIDPVTPVLTSSDFDGGAFPSILLGSRNKGSASKPGTLRIRISLSDGDTPLWTGVAHAPLDGRPRNALAATMAQTLATYVGEAIYLPTKHFEVSAPSITVLPADDSKELN